MGFSRQEFWSRLPLLALEPSKTCGWCPGPGLMAALRWCVLVPPGPGPTHGCSRRLRLRSRRHTPPLAAGPHPRRSCGGLQGSPGGGQVSAGQRNTVKLPRTVCQASQGRGSLVGCRLWGCTEADTTEATAAAEPALGRQKGRPSSLRPDVSPPNQPRMVMELLSRVWTPQKPRGPPLFPESYFSAKPTVSSRDKGGAGGLRGRWEKPRL